MQSSPKFLALGLSCLALSPLAQAQWSSDPANNLSVADAASDQVQPKLVATSDGGCFISWYDGIAGGFDVRLQKLDVAGNELFAHNGVLVADRGFSSTQDYDLAVDSAGHALLTFRDDRFGGVQISAARVSPMGVLVWGPAGIQLTNTSDFVAAPKIASLTGDEVVVAWTQNADTRLQKLDSAGANLWGADVIQTPPTGSYSASDLHGSGSTVVLAMVHQTGGFTSPKHLVTQKFDAAGAAQWGTSPLAVFDSGSLQFGAFPTFKRDGSGGAVFTWYGVGPLQCYAQHVLSNGVEAFPHNGAAGSTDLSQVRVAPAVDYDANTGETYMFWEELNGTQSLRGMSGQKFDGAGNRQWGASGRSLIALGSGDLRAVRTAVNASGAFVFWTSVPSFGTDVLLGRHLDAAGVTDIPAFDVASTPSGKSRPDLDLGTNGQVMIAWSDERLDGGDILAQNINPDGSLGAASSLGMDFCFGVACPCGNDDPTAGCQNSTGVGARLAAGGSSSVSADDLLISGSDLRPNAPALLFAGTLQVAGGAGTLFGDGLLCAGGSLQRLGVRFASSGGEALWGPGLASFGSWVSAGDTRYMQIWYRDTNAGPCASGFNTSHGLELLFGS